MMGELSADPPDTVLAVQRCKDVVDAFEAEVQCTATEMAAMLVERWHIHKGGYTALAHHIREEAKAAPVEEALGALPLGLYVVFDGPPSHVSGRFVELEDETGRGVGGVAWRQENDRWLLGPFMRGGF